MTAGTARPRIDARPVVAAGVVGAATVAGAVVAPLAAFGVLTALLAVIALVRWPRHVLVAYFFLIPFHFLFARLVTGRAGVDVGLLIYWKDVLLGGLLLRGVYDRIRADGVGIPDDPVLRLAIGYALFSGLVAVLSPDMHLAGVGLEHNVEGAVILLMVAAMRPSRAQIRACLVAMLAAAALIGLGGLIEQFYGPAFASFIGGQQDAATPFTAGLGTRRSSSVLVDPLELAFYTAAAAAAAAALAFTGGRLRHLARVALLLSVVGLVTTYTRSGWVGGGLGLLLAVVLTGAPVRRRALAAGGVVVVLGTGALAAVTGGVLSVTHSPEDTSAHLTTVQQDFDLVVAHPLGYGLGTVDSVAQRVGLENASKPGQLATSGSTTVAAFSSEDIYVAKGVQGGVAYFLLYIVLVLATMLRLRRLRAAAHHAGDAEATAIAAGAMGALVAVAVAGVTLGVEELHFLTIVWGMIGFAFVAARPLLDRAVQPVPVRTATTPARSQVAET